MKHLLPILIALLLVPFATLDAAGLDLSKVASRGDLDATALADATQLVFLEVQVGDLSDERLPLFQAFSFLKSLVIKSVKTPFSPETQTKVKALLPKVEVTFP
jgi:hypothetical protein